MKEWSQYTTDDVATLKKNSKFDEIEWIIDESPSLTNDLCSSIIRNTHDEEFGISLKTVEKQWEFQISPSQTDMTYLLLGATLNQNTDQLISLLIESAVKNIKFDVNTYINLLYYCHKYRKFDF